MADYGSDRSEEAAVSDGSGSEADLGTEKQMEKTRYMGPKWTGLRSKGRACRLAMVSSTTP